jgi:hypothetical protein
MEILAYPSNIIRQRKNQPKSFDERFGKILKAHGLNEDAEIKQYLDRVDSRGIWRLYVKFWADLRNDVKYANSLAFLKRYWVMAATYDGLSISLFIAILLLIEAKIGLIGNQPSNRSLAIHFNYYIAFTFVYCMHKRG